jgi:hypothetical protein
VHSSFVTRSGTLLDPMAPEADEGGIDAIAAFGTPRRIVLSNRHHYRDSARFVARFACPVLCHEAGLHEFADGREVRGFAFGAQLAEDVTTLELGAICPEETTLALDVGPGALSFADGLTRAEDGSLAFMPDWLLGEDPGEVKLGLTRSLGRMLDRDFDALLFAHADPVRSGGRSLLGDFLASANGA